MLAGFVLGDDNMLAQTAPAGARCELVDGDDIWVMDADGGAARNLTNHTNHPANGFGPSWSLDGAAIAVNTNRDCDDETFVTNGDGSALRKLGHTPASDQFPVWSLDGAPITFASDRSTSAAAGIASVASPVAGAAGLGTVADLPTCESRIAKLETIWALQGDCRTDSTIVLLSGRTPDGNGYTIWVVEPTGGAFTGNVIEGFGGTASVRNLTINGAALTEPCVDQWLAGIRFKDVAGTISNVTIEQLRRGPTGYCGTGIVVQGTPSGSVDKPVATVVANNTIRDVGFMGILARDRVEATIADNTVTGASFRGIYFRGPDVTGTARNNVVEQIEDIGIGVADAHGVLIAENTIVATYAAVLADTSATSVQIEDNRIRDGQYGIVFDHAGTSGTVVGNEITSVTDYGIIAYGAEVTVTGNTISGVNTGVGGVRGARLTAIGNEIAGAEMGLGVVGAGSRGHFVTNTIHEVTRYAIYIGDEAEATVEGNHVTSGAGWAITLAGGIATVRDNIITGGSVGIAVLALGSTGDVSGNTVVQPASIGIAVAEGAAATVSGNTVRESGGHGISIADESTRATVDANTVTNATETGVLITLGAHVPVTNNHVTGPGVDAPGDAKRIGISFDAATSGSIVGNTIEGYPVSGPADGCGIVVAAGAGPIDIRDNRFSEPERAHNICHAPDGGTPVATRSDGRGNPV